MNIPTVNGVRMEMDIGCIWSDVLWYSITRFNKSDVLQNENERCNFSN